MTTFSSTADRYSDRQL